MTETSSIVTALGGGSGIDMVALANNLADAQFQLRTERLTVTSEVLSDAFGLTLRVESQRGRYHATLA